MSRDTVVWTTSIADLLECGRDLGLRRERPLADEVEDRVLSLPSIHSMREL